MSGSDGSAIWAMNGSRADWRLTLARFFSPDADDEKSIAIAHEFTANLLHPPQRNNKGFAAGGGRRAAGAGRMAFGLFRGLPNLGGPIVTASGLVFIAAASDDKLRAFDVHTGRELWHASLPAGGQATPMTYVAGGRQFVVVAAGGHARMGTKFGDAVVAFALPAAGSGR